VALRVQHFTVPPATGPLMHVTVQNRRDAPYEGRISVRLPEGWRVEPAERPIALGPGETKDVAFTVAKGLNLDSNRYPVEAVATGSDGTVVSRKQEIACASAPFFQPKIDGRTGDWADAIPATFSAGGKRTTLSACWNRSDLCLLVEVEEEKHVAYRAGAEFDAVQVAIAPRSAPPAAKPDQKAGRHEFLLVGSASAWSRDKCFLLARADDALAATQEPRPLAPLELKAAKVSVRRKGRTTVYEAAIPLSAMPGIEPMEGRELCLSILVHDPDGTGLRDWGEPSGLWPWQRNRLAWSQWPGASWPKEPPFDSRIEWGVCSSKH